MKVFRCSLNGIDASTPHDELRRLMQDYRFADFGISYTNEPGQAGTGPYASMESVASFAKAFHRHPQMTLHVCSAVAAGDFLHARGPVTDIAPAFSRIQLNFNFDCKLAPGDLPLLRAAFDRFPDTTMITTVNPDHPELWKSLADKPNHEVLFDTSAGRGMMPGTWPDSLPGMVCGYAGGLSPETLAVELPRIHKAASANGGDTLWVDMESRLRNGARHFPLDRAETCLEVFAGHMGKPGMTPRASRVRSYTL